MHDEPFPVAGDAYLQRRTLRRLPGVMDKIAAGLRLQNKRNAFLFNAQQDIAPLFAAFVSDGNDDGGATTLLSMCASFCRERSNPLATALRGPSQPRMLPRPATSR